LIGAEVSRAIDEALRGEGLRLHPQCEKDFDRADYTVGDHLFERGAAADADAVKERREEFLSRIHRECGGSATLTYVASALASQLTMAHLGASCYSGAHAYAVPSGFTTPRYAVRRSGSNAVSVTVDRVSEGFTEFSLPGEDPVACQANSFIRQHASVLLRATDDAAACPEFEVKDAWEAMRLIWPDGRLVVHNGLQLDFHSPPLSTGAGGFWNFFFGPLQYLLAIAVACAVLAPKLAVGAGVLAVCAARAVWRGVAGKRKNVD